MSRKAPTAIAPWEDRWNSPTLERLLEPVEENRRKLVQTLLDRIHEYEGVSSQMVWFGTSWRWTLQIQLTLPGKGTQQFAYFIPRPEAPIFCLPLSEEDVEKLPMKRLNRFIREGIRSAKFAVNTHWCTWTPSAGTEIDHLSDLIKRVYKIYTTADAAAA